MRYLKYILITLLFVSCQKQEIKSKEFKKVPGNAFIERLKKGGELEVIEKKDEEKEDYDLNGIAPSFRYRKGGGGYVAERLGKMDDLGIRFYELGEKELIEEAGKLVKLAEWAIKTPGYGNYLLISRSREIASLFIARLFVDFDAKPKDYESLMSRIEVLDIIPEWSGKMLDNELGIEEFYRVISNMKDTTKKLGEPYLMWTFMKELVLVEDNPNNPLLKLPRSLLINQSKKNYIFRENGFSKKVYKELKPILREEKNKKYRRAFTHYNLWEERSLKGSLLGSGSSFPIRQSRALLEYKKFVGYFPTEFPKTAAGYYGDVSEIEKAFDYYSGKLAAKTKNWDLLNHSGLAASTYEKIKSKKLWDKDTKKQRRWKSKEKRRKEREEKNKAKK